MQVLIGHASAHGSTGDIAQRIASMLEHESLAVDVLPISQLGGLDGYDTAVPGSVIHNQAWLPGGHGVRRTAELRTGGPPGVALQRGMSASLPWLIRPSARTAQDRRLAAAPRDQGVGGSFLVTSTNQLMPEEEARARQWGADLAAEIHSVQP